MANDTSDDTADEAKDEEEPEPAPKPTPRAPGPKDDTRTGGDCSSGSGGWVEHGDLDKKNGNRATGVTACLTESYLDTHKGTRTNTSVVAPPGYRWAQRTAGFLGAHPVDQNINACHLLGKQLSGSGTQLENLATCSRGANAPQDGSRQGTNNMQNYENQVRAAVDAGQAVYYQVTPTYSWRRTVPLGFRISAYGTNPDGSTGIQIDAFVSNTLAGRNLGMFNDPKTGQQVPTGSTS
ncbi:DNA/RNA non-specific endonuclease [Streptomyces sp. H51]|uniref:DNA/RNA non-specific endonuclease n=1 Tax=Streptomyces sp. H51 TaxID=3111770 RepID=UPI003B636727